MLRIRPTESQQKPRPRSQQQSRLGVWYGLALFAFQLVYDVYPVGRWDVIFTDFFGLLKSDSMEDKRKGKQVILREEFVHDVVEM